MAGLTAQIEQATREELAKILESEPFTRSSRMKAFLSYVVEETLQGRGKRIKAFSIARDVFDKDESFDPQRDTIVRVEAGRLRRRLAAWYAGPGKDSPIRIEIPVGSYVPVITQAAPPASTRRRRGWLVLLVIPLAVLAWFWYVYSQGPETARSGTVPTVPYVAILPLNTATESAQEIRFAEGFVESLITSLAKLSGLAVMAHSSIMEYDPRDVNVASLREAYGVSHVLRGTLGVRGNAVLLNLQLVSTDSSTIVWADTLESAVDDIWNLQESLSRQVTDALAVNILPQEQEIYLRRHTDDFEALAYYRQGWVLLIPPNDVNRIMTARGLFQRATELDPDFAGGYAGDAFSHAISVLFIKAQDPGSELIRAAELAHKAIETDPGFGMGYGALSFTRALEGRVTEGLENARLAVELSPGDAFVQFIYGMNLVISGLPAEAVQPLQRAIKLDPNEVRTPYMNALAIALFANGEFTGCIEWLDRNEARGGPTGPHMDIFRAAALLGLGDSQSARPLVRDIQSNHPEFPALAWLRKWLANTKTYEETMKNLEKAGFSDSV